MPPFSDRLPTHSSTALKSLVRPPPLGSAVVSNRPAYRVLVQQLKGLLVAKVRLRQACCIPSTRRMNDEAPVEMYHPNTKVVCMKLKEMKFNALVSVP